MVTEARDATHSALHSAGAPHSCRCAPRARRARPTTHAARGRQPRGRSSPRPVLSKPSSRTTIPSITDMADDSWSSEAPLLRPSSLQAACSFPSISSRPLVSQRSSTRVTCSACTSTSGFAKRQGLTAWFRCCGSCPLNRTRCKRCTNGCTFGLTPRSSTCASVAFVMHEVGGRPPPIPGRRRRPRFGRQLRQDSMVGSYR